MVAALNGQIIIEFPADGKAIRGRIGIDVESAEVIAKLGRADAGTEDETAFGKSRRGY
jgi:hypothetical protein